jgi:hypothetical protein
MAQCVHAAGESASNVPKGTFAVVLEVENEEHLLQVADDLNFKCGARFKLIRESDPRLQRAVHGYRPSPDV